MQQAIRGDHVVCTIGVAMTECVYIHHRYLVKAIFIRQAAAYVRNWLGFKLLSTMSKLQSWPKSRRITMYHDNVHKLLVLNFLANAFGPIYSIPWKIVCYLQKMKRISQERVSVIFLGVAEAIFHLFCVLQHDANYVQFLLLFPQTGRNKWILSLSVSAHAWRIMHAGSCPAAGLPGWPRVQN